jgi:hypothetical protein
MSFLHRRGEERVRVLIPRVATMEALVGRVVPGGAELALMAKSPVPVRFLHRRPAAVVPLGGGDERLDGTLLAVPGAKGKVRDDLLHFLQSVVPLRTPGGEQRRDHVRIDFVRPVTMIPDGFQVGWLNGFTRNLSAGGILVAGAGGLDLGHRLRLRFELSDEDALLDLWGRVVRADEDWGLRGVHLESLPYVTRELLAKFVHERQRRALAELRAG